MSSDSNNNNNNNNNNKKKQSVWDSDVPQLIKRIFAECPNESAKLVIVIHRNLRLALQKDEKGVPIEDPDKYRDDRKIWIHVVEGWLSALKLVPGKNWDLKDIGHAFKTAKSRIWSKMPTPAEEIDQWDSASFVTEIHANFVSDSQWAKFSSGAADKTATPVDDNDDKFDHESDDTEKRSQARGSGRTESTTDDDAWKKHTPAKSQAPRKRDDESKSAEPIDRKDHYMKLIAEAIDAHSNVNATRLASIHSVLSSIDKSFKTITDSIARAEKAKSIESLKSFYDKASQGSNGKSLNVAQLHALAVKHGLNGGEELFNASAFAVPTDCDQDLDSKKRAKRMAENPPESDGGDDDAEVDENFKSTDKTSKSSSSNKSAAGKRSKT